MYRYYSTERKALEVTVPYGAAALHNYGDNGVGFERLGRVWGYAEYEKELTAEQEAKYQLTPAGQSPTYYPISEETARRAAAEALNAAEATLYRVNSALSGPAGKALDRDARARIKEAQKNLEHAAKRKTAQNMSTGETDALNTAREALEAAAAPLFQ